METAARGLVVLLVVALGARLVLQARRARKLPEALLGAFFVVMPLGLAVAVAGTHRIQHDYRVGTVLMHTGLLLAQLGMTAFALFVFRTFRSNDRWARALLAALVAALAATAVTVMSRPVAVVAPENFTPNAIVTYPRLAIFAWAAVECTRYYRMMRARHALGLAESVVTNRFLLFAMLSTGLVLIPLGANTLRWISPQTVTLFYRFVAVPAGVVMAAMLYLIFFPPSAYLHWLRTADEPQESADD